MNIFAVDVDPRRAAVNLCDNHVTKMLLESAQMLCTVADTFGMEGVPYRPLHTGHPCVKWIMASYSNWEWLLDHAHELGLEYTRRRTGKTHKTQSVIAWMMQQNPEINRFYKDDVGVTPFALAVWPKEPYYNNRTLDGNVQIYREYYARKELAWAELARMRALANHAAGLEPSKNNRPVMKWTPSTKRPDWLPEKPPKWKPTARQMRLAERWGQGKDFDPKNLTPEQSRQVAAIAGVEVAVDMGLAA